MSSGPFVNRPYELDNGDFARIRVQPETLELVLGGETNNAPTGVINNKGSVRVNGSRRRFGVNARLVYIKYTGSPVTGGPNAPIALPWLNKATFDDLDPTEIVSGTYLGRAVELTGKRSEVVK